MNMTTIKRNSHHTNSNGCSSTVSDESSTERTLEKDTVIENQASVLDLR